MAQGIAWDEAASLFIGEAGDDTYLYTDQARAGGNDYHGGKSVSFFLDQGGEDSYPSRENGARVFGGDNSIFVDVDGP